MRNIYREFIDLMPGRPLEVGDVTAVGVGMATVTLPGGGVLNVRGEATLNQRVFVRDGVIESPAPTLT